MNELSLKYFPLKTSTWSLTCCQSNSHSIQYHMVCLILYGIWIFDCRHNLANRQITIVVMVAQIFRPHDEVSSSVLFWETHSVSGTVRKKNLNFCCFQLCSGLFLRPSSVPESLLPLMVRVLSMFVGHEGLWIVADTRWLDDLLQFGTKLRITGTRAKESRPYLGSDLQAFLAAIHPAKGSKHHLSFAYTSWFLPCCHRCGGVLGLNQQPPVRHRHNAVERTDSFSGKCYIRSFMNLNEWGSTTACFPAWRKKGPEGEKGFLFYFIF